jgi:ATP-dependent exoDNAse (exonuclease V) alpha subunit
MAKLLHEWSRPDPEPDSRYRLPATTTVVVDEAGMIGTPDLRRLVDLTQRNRWRLVLVGDPRQLQPVGRGGLFGELCGNGRVHQLEQVHRFTHAWEAEASLLLRAGDPRALHPYEAIWSTCSSRLPAMIRPCVEDALNLTSTVVYRTLDDGTRIKVEAETLAANDKKQALCDRLAE